VFGAAVGVGAEVAHTLELHVAACRHGGEVGLGHGGDDLLGILVEVVEEGLAFFDVGVGFRGEHLFVQAHFRGHGVTGADPVDSALDLAAVGAGAAAGGGVVGAVQLDDVAVLVLDDFLAGDVVGVAQAHFHAGSEAEVLLGRIFAEVVTVDPQFAAEGHLAAAEGLVFGMQGLFEFFHLVFGVVGDDYLDGVEHSHAARSDSVEVFAAAEFQQAVMHLGVGGAGDADAGAEVADGFGGIAAAAKAADGGHAGVVPAAHVAFLHQLDELALGEHGVGKVEAGKLDLLGTVHIKGVEHPVVELTVIVEF